MSRIFGALRALHRRRSTSRRRRLTTVTIIALAAGFALQLVGIAPALANAANPNPDISGTATVNADGTVTAKVGGTWSWPGQNCAGRYGTGWAVDWWGISSTSVPSPSFSLTNASEVVVPGSTTTGTVSPAGAIAIKAAGAKPGTASKYFHVGQYYAGETINSPSTCTDTGSGKTGGSTGAWSATATYPSLSDIPAQVCVNMYDEHGQEGVISKNANDFSPTKDGDNSIQTNDFDPTVGMGYCVALQVVTQKIQAEIYQCVNGAPSTTLASGGSITVPSAGLSSGNPLAPTAVAAGTYTVNATAPSGQQFVACGQSGVTIATSSTAHQSVTVPAGGTGNGRFYVSATAPTYGYLEICKSSANGVTSGSFTFAVAGTTVTVPAGACSSAIKVTAGTHVVHENYRAGYGFVSASTSPSTRLVSVDASSADVSVRVVTGDVSTQTILTVVNKHTLGTLKICQVAGSGVAVGTQFNFTNSVNSTTTQVPAGSAPGGYCSVVSTTLYQAGRVTITQAIPTGDRVTSIVVGPSTRIYGTADLTNGKVTVTIGSGVTEVTYTDQSGY